MRRSQPLPDSYPEFTVLEYPGFCEYRVENWHLARDGSGRVIRNTSSLGWKDAIAAVVLSFVWPRFSASSIISTGLALFSMTLVWLKCTQVLFESVVVLNQHGIQFETHRGLPPTPFIVSRHFVPATALQDFIINEGLRRWNVRYYLAAVTRSDIVDSTLEVAYENILPHFPILQEVYRGVHETFSFSSPLDRSTMTVDA